MASTTEHRGPGKSRLPRRERNAVVVAVLALAGGLVLLLDRAIPVGIRGGCGFLLLVTSIVALAVAVQRVAGGPAYQVVVAGVQGAAGLGAVIVGHDLVLRAFAGLIAVVGVTRAVQIVRRMRAARVADRAHPVDTRRAPD